MGDGTEAPMQDAEDYADRVWRGRSFADTTARRVSLRRVKLIRCDLSNAVWDSLRLEDVTFEGCRLTGFRLYNTKGKRVAFKKCQGRYVQFEGCKLPACRVEGCELRESSFVNSEFEGAVFHETDLSQSVISQVRFTKADLRGSSISGLRVALSDLRGAIVDPEQAVALLAGSAEITVIPVGAEMPAG